MTEFLVTINLYYLIFNIDDEKSICTAIEKLSKRRDNLYHNPNIKTPHRLMKFCLDKNIHLIENIDGSAEICFDFKKNDEKPKKKDIFRFYHKKHKKYIYLAVSHFTICCNFASCPYRLYAYSIWSSNK